MFDFDFCNALPVQARVGSSTITAIYYYYYYYYYICNLFLNCMFRQSIVQCYIHLASNKTLSSLHHITLRLTSITLH